MDLQIRLCPLCVFGMQRRRDGLRSINDLSSAIGMSCSLRHIQNAISILLFRKEETILQ